MRADLPYSNALRRVLIPDGVKAEFITPREVTPIDDIDGALRQAVAHPIGSAPLADTLTSRSRVLVVISDVTRGGGLQRLLSTFVQYLAEIGVSAKQVRILVARGTHRAMTREEKKFFKTGLLQYVAVEEHDCDTSPPPSTRQ